MTRTATRDDLPAHATPDPLADTIVPLWLAIGATALVLVVAWRFVAPLAARIAFPQANLEAFPSTRALFRPKPVGFVRYFLDVAAAALIVPIFLWLRPNARRYVRSSSWLSAGVALVQVGTVALVITCCVRQEDLHRWFSVWQLGAGIIVGCSVLAIAVYARGRPTLIRLPERMRLVGSAVGFGGAGVVTLGSLLPAVFTEGNVGHAFGGARAQIAVVFDEVSAVANGRHPLVDFAPQYTKLLPYVLRPFAAAPGWSIGRFTFLMALLSFVALYSVYLVLVRVTGGPFSALALFIAVVAISSVPQVAGGNERVYAANLFDFVPFRILGPMVLAALCAWQLARARLRFPIWLFVVAGLVAINNPELGVPSFVGLGVALWCGRSSDQGHLSALRLLVLRAASGFLLALTLVCGLTLATAGSLPDLSKTTEVGRLFVVDGLGALPTPVFGLHVLVYLTFVAAFVAGVLSGWPQHRSATTTPALRGMLAYSGVLGLGGLSVFAGRSHPLALSGVFPIWAFATVLLVWLLVQSITRTPALSPSVVLAWLAPALLLVTMFGVMVATLSQYPAPWTQISRITGDTARPIDGYAGDTELHCFFAPQVRTCAPLLTKADRAPAVRFVARHTASGDHVLILATAGHVIARESGVVNVSPYGYPDLILSGAQMRSVLGELHENNGAKVFVGATWPEIPAYLSRHGFQRKIRDPKSGLVEWELRQT